MVLFAGVSGLFFWSSWITADLCVRVKKMGSVPLFGTEPIAFGSGVLFQEG